MSSKENNFKEQFKQALISTAKVISEDYKLDVKKLDKDLSNKKTDFFDITNLSNKNELSSFLLQVFPVSSFTLSAAVILLLLEFWLFLHWRLL